MSEMKPLTHTAYAIKRESRTIVRWLEIGVARVESNGTGHHQIHIDRLPVGGFDGRIYLAPIGSSPQEPDAQPTHPSQPLDITNK